MGHHHSGGTPALYQGKIQIIREQQAFWRQVAAHGKQTLIVRFTRIGNEEACPDPRRSGAMARIALG